jgi:hypothetical protein
MMFDFGYFCVWALCFLDFGIKIGEALARTRTPGA